MIIFSHIGYFLVSDNRFLFPLSTMAGVGVNLFLFVSGYGLTASMQKKKLSIKEFYERHLSKLYVPFWIVIFSLFFLDFFVLHINYDLPYIARSALGFFPHSNLYQDVDSPLWYFTLIVFYYLAFPIFFSEKKPWASALGIYAFTFLIFALNIPAIAGIQGFYTLHAIAFPLGIMLAWLFMKHDEQCQKIMRAIKNASFFRYAGIISLLLLSVGLAVHFSGISTPYEQGISIATMLLIISLFLLKRFEVRLLALFGVYSYELYLLHWPIMYRYDIFYRFAPAWLATALYLALFIGLGWFLKKIVSKI